MCFRSSSGVGGWPLAPAGRLVAQVPVQRTFLADADEFNSAARNGRILLSPDRDQILAPPTNVRR